MSVKDTFTTLVSCNLPLSRHFTLSEMFASATATDRKIINCPPTHTKLRRILCNLVKLSRVLELVRAAHGAPVIVTSGYRCGELNEAVGGNIFSAHMDGRAADITANDFYGLLQSVEFLDLPQVTYYYDDEKKYIHLQIKIDYE